MPTVILSHDLARRFSAGETHFEMAAQDVDTVRAVVRALDARFPGIGPELRNESAVALDGVIHQGALLTSVEGVAEICFMPAIEGG